MPKIQQRVGNLNTTKMAYKVVKDVDKFSDKTTLTMNKEFALSNGTTIFTHRATIGIRHLSMPDVDTILLDYSYSEVDGDCLYLDGGNLILRINNRENISLPFLTTGERSSSKYEDNNGREHTRSSEYNYVEIDKTILEKICNATSIELKVGGRYSKEYSASKCDGLINYCKIFYNGLYNTDLSSIEESSKGGGDSAGILKGVAIGLLLGILFLAIMFALVSL